VRVARLEPDGSPDANFSENGQVIINTSFAHQNILGPVDVFKSVVQDSNGNIVFNKNNSNLGINANTNDLILIGDHKDDGDFSDNPQYQFSMVVLSSVSGGQFTDAFGSNQVKTVSFTAFNSNDTSDRAFAAVVQPLGTILVTGSSGASTDQIPLARFKIDGSLDPAFGSSTQPGTELLAIPGHNAGNGFSMPSGVNGMAFQDSANVILAATAKVNGQNQLMLVRLKTSTDTIDSSFGASGVELVPLPANGTVTGLAVDRTSGRIIVAGSNYLAALSSNGSPDTTFGPSQNGVVSTGGMTASDAALQSDGKIVVSGRVVSAGKNTAALARYEPNGVLDTTFNGTGMVVASIGTSYNTVAVQPVDGKIVAAGFTSGTTVVARYIGETPDITGLSPSNANVGGPSFTLSVTGKNFISGSQGSQVFWNGTPLNMVSRSATTLNATVPASDLLQAGTASVTVVNPGNITSNAFAFTISGKTTPDIIWPDPGAITYGTPLSSTQLDANASVPGSFQYAPDFTKVLHAGLGQPLMVTFIPTDAATYNNASKTVHIDVNKFTPILDVQVPGPTYDGKPHRVTFMIKGTNDDDLTSQVRVTYNGSSAEPVNAGIYNVSISFPGNSDYIAVSKIAQLGIAKGTPQISWPSPADIVAGTPLSGVQQNATPSVPGILTYLPSEGIVLAAGSGQILSARFVPTDTLDYNSVTAQVSISVLPAPPPPPHVAPRAAGAKTKKGLTSITVAFDEPMNLSSVTSKSNYAVYGAVTKKKKTVYAKLLNIKPIIYSSSLHAAIITLSKPYKGNVRITVKSSILADNGARLGESQVVQVK
jgi:uncharacterized delta-60 repeat protein